MTHLALNLMFGVLVFYLTLLGFSIYFASWIKRDPLEGMTLGVGITLFMLYGIMFLFHDLHIPYSWLYLFSISSLFLLVLKINYIREIIGNAEIRKLVWACGLLTVWILWHLAFIQTYNGGRWAGDWIEHYERAIFLIEPLPLDYLFLDEYSFTARPPLANAVCGLFMAMTGTDFAFFQLFSSLTGSLVILPAVLLLRQFSTQLKQQAGFSILLILLMLNPMFMYNSTYAWTRMLCTFFILLGLFYFARSYSSKRVYSDYMMAFLALAVGSLVHYSTGPFIVAFLVLYILAQRKQIFSLEFWRQTLLIGLACGFVLFTWFGWATVNFGLIETFFSNSSVTYAKDITFGENIWKIVANIFNTLVPHPLRGPAAIENYHPGNLFYYFRDYFFYLYQVSLFPAFGALSGIVLLLHFRPELWKSIRTSSCWRSVWVLWSLIVVVLGIAVHGAYDQIGLAHICLQPFIFAGIVLLAAIFENLSKRLKITLFFGLAFDYLLGIALHFYLLHSGPNLFRSILTNRGTEYHREFTEQVGPAVEANYQVQLYFGYSFLGEQLPLPTGIFFSVSAIIIGLVIYRYWGERTAVVPKGHLL